MPQFIESYILNAFVSFAENKTLTHTAEKLHISQPSLSLTMQKLEEQMGVKEIVNRKILKKVLL